MHCFHSATGNDPAESEENKSVLPSHLSHNYRDPLQVSPEVKPSV